MHKVAAAILLLAFLGQTFNQEFYYLGYLANKAAYEKSCVNKLRPMLHCNGKCQLMKKIEEAESKERGLPPEMKLASKSEVLSSRSFFLLNALSVTIDNTKEYFLADSGCPIDQPSFFFHPPAASSC